MVAHPSFLIELDYVESIFDPCMCFLQFNEAENKSGAHTGCAGVAPRREQSTSTFDGNPSQPLPDWEVDVLRPYHPSDGRL